MTAAVTAVPTTYSVVSGDTLAKIAAEHSIGGGWQQLYEANRSAVGANPSVIRPGLKLQLGSVAPAAVPAAVPAATRYANNLDGWIRQSLDVMARHGIPGSYDGIHRNVMRESSGNPMAINNWDSNAAPTYPPRACSR